jgi:hypothetical protein
MVRVMRCSAYAKLVYTALLDHADDDGCCYPSIELLAEEASISARAVRRALPELVDLHILRIERRYTKSSLYTLLDPSHWRLTDEEKALFEKHRDQLGYRMPGSAYQDDADSQAGLMRTDRPHDEVMRTDRPHDEDSQAGLMRTDRPHNEDSQTYEEEPVKKNQLRRTKEEVRPPISPPRGFVSFMLAYPKGSHEQQALEEWMKLDPDEALASHIVACVGRAQDSEQWKKGMIPYAYKYLRDQCWKDDRLHFAQPTGPSSEGLWNYDVKSKTYECLTDGKWIKHPRSDVPDHVIQQFEVNPVTPFARTAAAPKVTS